MARLSVVHPPRTAIAITLLVTGLSACAPAPTVTHEPSPAESPRSSPTPTPIALDARERLAGIPLPEADERWSLPRCDPARSIDKGPSEPAAQPLAAGPIELDVVGQLGGRLTAATMLGHRLVAGVGPRMLVFETQPTFRETGASAPLGAAVTALTEGDAIVLAALGPAGIALLDIASGSPEVVGSLTIAGIAHSAAIFDKVAYVASGPTGLRLVDLTDPSQPRELGAVFGLHDVLDVAVLSGRAYVAAADEGLLVADVSDPRAPRELGRFFTGGYASEIEITGTTAYLADGWGGLRVIDVADPSRPTLLGTVPTAGWAVDVAIQNGTAYVAAGADGLIIADVTKPSDPVVLAGLPLAHRQATQVVVGAGMAYVVDPSDGLQFVDIQSAASPKAVATWQPLAEADAMAVAGGHAYVAGGRSGLRSVDLADPTSPTEGAAIPTISPVGSVARVGERVLFSTIIDPASDEVTSLFHADTSSPDVLRPSPGFLLAGRLGRATFPIEESEYYGTTQTVVAGPAWSVAVEGSMALYAIEAGLLIVDGGGPAPCELAFVETAQGAAFSANSVAVRGQVAYVGIDPGMYIVDISDPRAPEFVKRIGDGGGGPSLINGDLLYVVAGESLVVLDISEPMSPIVVGSMRLPPQPVTFVRQRTIALAGGRLFVTAGAEVVGIDVSDPTRPRRAGGLTVPGEALGVATDGDHLYIGSNEGGLLVADWRTVGSRPPSGQGDLAGGIGWTGLVESIHRPAPAIAPRDTTGSPTPSTTCMVTTTADEGPGTLRECLDMAQSETLIAFDAGVFSVDRPGTIQLESPLELMTPGITIDGRGTVILDGGGQVEAGFDPNARNVTIRGLHIRNFEFGILLSSATSGSVIEDNVISGNRFDLAMGSARGNRIVNNRIGVDASGTKLVRHPDNIFGSMNIEGGSSLNRFEGNAFGWSVFVVDSGSSENSFVGNRFGVDPSGRRLPCECAFTVAEPNNQVGGSGVGEGNIFGGTVVITHDNILLGNVILGDGIEGFDDSGKPRQLDAPRGALTLQGPGNVVGGRSASAGNQIGGSWAVEVWPGALDNLIVGNAIGGLAGARDRTEIGIRVLGSTNVIIANDVVAAGKAGIVLASGSSRNVVAANALIDNRTGGTDDGSGNQWDVDGRGNFWSDYEGADLDGDGIGDSPRRVAPNGIDRYPLVRPG